MVMVEAMVADIFMAGMALDAIGNILDIMAIAITMVHPNGLGIDMDGRKIDIEAIFEEKVAEEEAAGTVAIVEGGGRMH